MTKVFILTPNDEMTDTKATLADYIVPILQRAMAKAQAQKKENE